MAAGYSALLINAVYDVLKAGAVSGLGLSGAADVLMAANAIQNKAMPYVQVRLPQEPHDTQGWAGTSNLKNSQFRVLVDVLTEITGADEYPYGTASAAGALTLADKVMDLLEVQYSTLLAASPRAYDVLLDVVAHERNDGNTRQVAVTISVIFKVRFFKGGRSAA